MLTHLSLFSGIGGIDISAEAAGFQTICFVEKDGYCQKVLKKHWSNTPIIGDIKDVTKKKIEEVITNSRSGSINPRTERVRWEERADLNRCCEKPELGQKEETIANTTQLHQYASDYQSQESRTQVPESGNGDSKGNISTKSRSNQSISSVTLLTAGVPCQPASVAGKRRGKEDDRWLWLEAIRVLRLFHPTWAVFENPAGINSLDEYDSIPDMESEAAQEIPGEYSAAIDEICGQIEEIGYSIQTFLIPACAVNAPHRRDRIFIVGYNTNQRGDMQGGCSGLPDVESMEMEDKLKWLRLPKGAKQKEGNQVAHNFNALFHNGNQGWRGDRPYQSKQTGQSQGESANIAPLSELPPKSNKPKCVSIKRGQVASEDLREQQVSFLGNVPDEGRSNNGLLRGQRTISGARPQTSRSMGYSQHNGRDETQGAQSIGKGSNDSTPRQEQTWQLEGPGEQQQDVANAQVSSERGLPIGKGKEDSGLGKCHQDVADSKAQGLSFSQVKESPQGTSRAGLECKGIYGGRETDNWAVESQLGGMADGLPYGLDGHWWDMEPAIPRVATGVKNRVDRLRCLGNAVVPAQIYPLLKAIADIELGVVGNEET